jgi:hypothetical protein
MYCQCGCGEVTTIAKQNRKPLGHIRGQHIPFIMGHSRRGKGNLANYAINEAGCWLWQGKLKNNGYASVSYRGKVYYAHRFMYEKYKGKIPDGLDIDHLCRVRHCVNPDHLDAVSRQENLNRGLGNQYTKHKRVAVIKPAATEIQVEA